MENIFFTSDTHFGHDKDFLLNPRGFSDWKEAGEKIVENWNKVVKPGDTVWHLGDMMLNQAHEEQAIEWIKQLNGKIFWIYGNHDTKRRIQAVLDACDNLEVIGYALAMKFGGKNFFLCHYPTMTGNFDEGEMPKVISLFGHTHQKTNDYNGMKGMYHVGLDSHDCTPVSLDTILTDLKTM